MTNSFLSEFRKFQSRRAFPSLILSSIIFFSSIFDGYPLYSSAQAAQKKNNIVVSSTGKRTYQLTFKELGSRYPLNLRGVDGKDSVRFNIRADEVVTKALLKIQYTYSPALLRDLSHINVLVNDEITYTIAIPTEDPTGSVEKTIELPINLITEFNQIQLQLIGHYTLQCEDPLHSSLWVNVSNNSILELTIDPVKLQNDLAILPLPFIDIRDSQPPVVPFVFMGPPNKAVLESAAIVSSWLGTFSKQIGVRFPVSLDGIPAKGSAVVAIVGQANISGVDIGALTGPTVAMVANPSDENGKLLLIMGRDDAELKLAATALATGSKALNGERAVISQLDNLVMRKPYDAPRWMSSERKVKLGELATEKILNVSGYNPGPIDINMRVPPDIFGWNNKGAPFDLKYRYTPQPVSSLNSSLLIGVDEKFVKSIQLFPIEKMSQGAELLAKILPDATLPMEEKMRLPLFMLQPRSQLQLRYMYDYIKEGECHDVIIDNVRGAIDPESTIDLTGFSHFIAMPNLSVFSNSGFPFTRLADLSRTAVILPDNASKEEYSVFLTAMSRMGESTGYPVMAITVNQGADAKNIEDKDLLIIASGGNQPLLKQWAKYLPADLDGDNKTFNLSDWVFKIWSFFSPQSSNSISNPKLSYTSGGNEVLFAGFESPLQSNRSAVLIWGAKAENLVKATDLLLGAEGYEGKIEGNLSVLNGTEIENIAHETTYYLGSLFWVEYIQWWLSNHLFVFLLFAALSTVLLAGLIYLMFRVKAKRKLM